MIFQDNELSNGEFGEDDREALRNLVRMVLKPGCVIVEIGSWLGNGSTRVIIDELRSIDGGKLYCVDTWKGSPNVAHHQDIAARYDIFETFLQNVRSAGGEAYVCPLKMTSSDAAKIIEDGSIDLVFIDGDHSYASAIEDISLWKSKVREGGILCGHDCECRPRGSLRDAIYSSLNIDHISGDGTPFSVIHSGVVVAVDEAFNGSANLWAETPFLRANGTLGRATMWDNRSPSTVERQAFLPSTDFASPPRLVGVLSSYNIVSFSGVHYAVPQSLGSMDLSSLEGSSMPPGIFVCSSYDEAILAIVVAELKYAQELMVSMNERLSRIDAELGGIKAQQESADARGTEVDQRLNGLLSRIDAELGDIKVQQGVTSHNPMVRIGRLIGRLSNWNNPKP